MPRVVLCCTLRLSCCPERPRAERLHCASRRASSTQRSDAQCAAAGSPTPSRALGKYRELRLIRTRQVVLRSCSAPVGVCAGTPHDVVSAPSAMQEEMPKPFGHRVLKIMTIFCAGFGTQCVHQCGLHDSHDPRWRAVRQHDAALAHRKGLHDDFDRRWVQAALWLYLQVTSPTPLMGCVSCGRLRREQGPCAFIAVCSLLSVAVAEMNEHHVKHEQKLSETIRYLRFRRLPSQVIEPKQ